MSDEDSELPPSEKIIGYGRPPAKSRFQKGSSGNPNGRPKGSRNLSTLIDQIVSERIPVTINGKRRKLEKREAILLQLVNKAAGGDRHATKLITELMHRHETPIPDDAAASLRVLAPDLEVWNALRNRRKPEGTADV